MGSRRKQMFRGILSLTDSFPTVFSGSIFLLGSHLLRINERGLDSRVAPFDR